MQRFLQEGMREQPYHAIDAVVNLGTSQAQGTGQSKRTASPAHPPHEGP